MNIWRRLLHPWWRPTVILLDLLGLVVIAGCFAYGYSIAWILPFALVNLVGIGLMWREAWVRSDPLAQSRPESNGEPERSDPRPPGASA